MFYMNPHFDSSRPDHMCRFNSSLTSPTSVCPACGSTVSVVDSDGVDVNEAVAA